MENGLVVVTEKDISEWLENNDIHPQKLFTDLEKFRGGMNFLKTANVVFLIHGLTSFKRNWVLKNLVLPITERVNSGNDRQFKSITVISNISIEGLGSYYIYMDTPKVLYKVTEGTVDKKPIKDFWEKLDYERTENMRKYLAEDTQDVISKHIDNQEKLREMNEDYSLIKKPSFS